jgi:hypothetical protein
VYVLLWLSVTDVVSKLLPEPVIVITTIVCPEVTLLVNEVATDPVPPPFPLFFWTNAGAAAGVGVGVAVGVGVLVGVGVEVGEEELLK